jgi:nuclear pore complex protein Nup133
VIDDAIHHTMQLQGGNLHSGLTAIDLFYKEVSSLQTIFQSLVISEEALLVPDLSHDESFEIIELVNKSLEIMVNSAIQHRQTQCHILGVDSLPQHVAAHLDADCQYWTDTDGIDGVRTILAKQLNIVFDNAETLPNGLQLLQSVRGLADIFLTTFTLQLEIYRKLDLPETAFEEVEQRFSQYRSMAIKPFVAHGLSETATVLAERYCDFSTLIELCESEHDETRLQSYAEQFERDGFTQFLLKYYMDQGQLGKLLSQPLSRHSALTEFLKAHPHLSWLHHIQTGSFSEAHEVLTDLADCESEEVSRKRTLLCLSKLSLLASSESTEEQEQEIQRINDELDIILHQEQLGNDVLQAGGIDLEKQPPLTVEQLIEFYTSNELNPSASASDFKKALDLVKYTDDREVDQDQLTILIWCKAILRNSWYELEGVEPAESLRETMFFQIIKLAFSEGINLKGFIPKLDSLLNCDELKASGLADDRHFIYLIKMGYEQLDLEE